MNRRAAPLPATIVSIMTVMMMIVAVVIVAGIGVVVVIAWVEIGITVIRRVIRIVSVEIIG